MFYVTKGDTQIDLDVLLQSFDLWIKRVMKSGSGAAAITGGSPDLVAFTPGVGGMTESEFVGGTLLFGGEEWDITANTTTVITASRADSDLENGDFPFRVMHKPEYIGLSDSKAFTRKPEFATLTTGIPKRRIRKDLVSLEISVKGSLQNYNKDLLQILWNLKDRSTASRFIGRGGSNPSAAVKAEFVLQSATVANKATGIRLFYAEISGDGDLPLDSDKHKDLGFTIDGFADPLRVAENTTIQDDDVFEFYEDL